jgi:hypothetical protein
MGKVMMMMMRVKEVVVVKNDAPRVSFALILFLLHVSLFFIPFS